MSGWMEKNIYIVSGLMGERESERARVAQRFLVFIFIILIAHEWNEN